MNEKIEVFICYAREDEALRQGLEKQLRVLQRQGLITLWQDRNISPGADWRGEIDTYLNSAHVILLLVSPDFMDSDYCYGIEMQRAVQRHEQGLTRVLPIILRPVYWQGTPFGKLQVLPTDAKSIVSAYWHTQDEAFFNVAEGIRETVEKLRASPQFTSSKKDSQAPQKTIEQLQGEGEVFCALEQYEEALTAFNEILQMDSGNRLACSWKGEALYNLKRYEEALAAREEAIRLGSTFGSDHRAKGNCLHKLERYEEAVEAYDQALRMEPSDIFTYSGKGAALYNLKRYEEALAAREEAIRLGSTSQEGVKLEIEYHEKGECLVELRRYEEAIAAYDQAIQVNPSFTDAYRGKAKAIKQQRQLKQK